MCFCSANELDSDGVNKYRMWNLQANETAQDIDCALILWVTSQMYNRLDKFDW